MPFVQPEEETLKNSVCFIFVVVCITVHPGLFMFLSDHDVGRERLFRCPLISGDRGPLTPNKRRPCPDFPSMPFGGTSLHERETQTLIVWYHSQTEEPDLGSLRHSEQHAGL